MQRPSSNWALPGSRATHTQSTVVDPLNGLMTNAQSRRCTRQDLIDLVALVTRRPPELGDSRTEGRMKRRPGQACWAGRNGFSGCAAW